MPYIYTIMIKRQLYEKIRSRMFGGKAIILSGPRQAGKTTLIREILHDQPFLFLDGDDPFVRNTLIDISTERLKTLIGEHKIVFIDESQRIENIGLTSKIIVDQLKGVQLILSGSSSFEMNEKIKEPLTGRKWTFELFPVSFSEWFAQKGLLSAMQSLEDQLVFGFYPDILNHPEDRIELLKELVDSYLFKDILLYANIKKADVIFKLVRALAYQVGSEVVYNEVAQLIGVDSKTVSNYIDILEKAFVVFRLPSYSTNQRNEIKKGVKVYFYDNGVRNAVINAFESVNNRKDIGALWENFLVAERLKQNSYQKRLVQSYFWRTTQQQEIDYVEVSNDKIQAFEFKWNSKAKARFSTTFTNHYDSENTVITKENYIDFVNA